MIFTIRFRNPNSGRCHSLNCIAPGFYECLEKISSMYGKNLVSITYDCRKNEGGEQSALSEKS